MDAKIKDHLPIDRSWAWVICLATFGLFALVAGTFKSQGVILVELQERFPEASTTSLLWVFSLCNVIHCSSGLFTGFLLSKLTHRTVAVIGTLLSSVAMISFGYSPTVGYMYAFFSILYGFSSSFLAVTSLTAYTNYFDKKKALALGITASGAGIGGVCVPPFLRVLFDNFDFSSAILLFGGFILQLIVLACLIRPISFYEELAKKKLKSSNRVAQAPVTSDAEIRSLTDNGGTNYSNELSPPRISRRQSEATAMPKLLPSGSIDKLCMSTPNMPLCDDPFSDQIGNKSALFHSTSDMAGSTILHQITKQSQLKNKFNWRVVLRKESILMGLGSVFFSCGIGVVYQCIPPLGKSSGVSKETVALILAIAGGVEIPCRILNGMLADRKLISAISQLSLCMCLAGVAALLCARISGLAGIIIMMFTMAMCGTSVFSLIPIASGELLGQENVSTALGINMVYQSLAMITSTFSSGGIYESLGRWEYVYYFIGGVMLSGGLINGCLAIYSFYVSKLTAKTSQQGVTI